MLDHNGDEEPEIKVTRIGKRWHARLLYNGKVFDEMACAEQRDIGWICREMLRWFSKLGGCSAFADAARERQGKTVWPTGKVWHLGGTNNGRIDTNNQPT